MAQSCRFVPYAKRQAGFTLVEMMVAMAIGLVVTMGAGQLLIASLQNYQATRALGERQALLAFTMESLVQDIRRAVDPAFDNGTLMVSRSAGGDCTGTLRREYRQGGFIGDAEGWELVVREWCEGEAPPAFQPFAAGLAEGGFELAAGGNSVWDIILTLFATEQNAEATVSLRVVNRAQALSEP